jgi:predicted RNA-binding protein with PUA-like domain
MPNAQALRREHYVDWDDRWSAPRAAANREALHVWAKAPTVPTPRVRDVWTAQPDKVRKALEPSAQPLSAAVWTAPASEPRPRAVAAFSYGPAAQDWLRVLRTGVGILVRRTLGLRTSLALFVEHLAAAAAAVSGSTTPVADVKLSPIPQEDLAEVGHLASPYWLVKSEPGKYAFSDLVRDGRTVWDGVRNAQAALYLKAMREGDSVLYYHSQTEPGVVGLARVTREAFIDPTDPTGRFVAVEIEPVRALSRPVPLAWLRADARLAGMVMFRQFRLSVTPISPEEWSVILELGARVGC